MGLFNTLFRTETISEQATSEICAQSSSLFEGQFSSYMDYWNIDYERLYETINRTTEARILLVAYGDALGAYCTFQVLRDLEVISDLDILIRSVDLKKAGYSESVRQKILRRLWSKFDPICQSNLDYELRKIQRKSILTDVEREFYTAVSSYAAFHLDGYFRFERAMDSEWLDLLRLMVDENRLEVIEVINRWLTSPAYDSYSPIAFR